MLFPDVKRVIYRNNPLEDVVCQLRFQPILRIDTDVPAKFQESIRSNYPNFNEESEVVIGIPSEASQHLPADIVGQAIKSMGIKNYSFSSDDGLWKVNLTRTFLALSTKQYKKWEEFVANLQEPFEALMAIYSPGSFSRVGLRYIDIIKRSKLGIETVPWRELLQPHVAGILTLPEIADSVTAFENVYNISLDTDRNIARIVMKFVKATENDEICFMIDSDFSYTGKMASDEILPKLQYFNVNASRLIRWAISSRLHDAMRPEEL